MRFVKASRILAPRHHDLRQLRRRVDPQLDHDAPLLRQIAPTCPGRVHDLVQDTVDIDACQLELGLARAVEFPHAGHCGGNVVDGALD